MPEACITELVQMVAVAARRLGYTNIDASHAQTQTVSEPPSGEHTLAPARIVLTGGLVQSSRLYRHRLLTAIQAMAAAFDLPARQALVPNLVPTKDLPNAFSLQSIAAQTGAIVGPALGGLVIAYFGQAYVYLINAISFLAVFVALILMGSVEQKSAQTPRRAASRTAIMEGIQFILHQPIILSTMLIDFFATFFSSANFIAAC